jgi:hypothetical protein
MSETRIEITADDECAAACSCGWYGQLRQNIADCDEDAYTHETEAHPWIT